MHRNDDKDAFWDLSSLLPPRKRTEEKKRFATAITPAPVNAEGEGAANSIPKEELQLTPRTEENCEVIEYQPTGNNLIRNVRVLRRVSDYNFYDRFRRDAIKYLGEERTEEVPFAPFFSYIPQYAQLSEAQREYYFYWRSAVRRGEYPRTEESYYFLYIYEIINLPECIPSKQGVELLISVWAGYRKALPRIDKYMAEWFADYCLVHGISGPFEGLRPFLAKILPHATMKEFYLGAMGDYTPRGIDTALAFFSDYRWRDSRYAAGENYALFETHIFASLAPVVEYLFTRERFFVKEASRTICKRDAFCGSLCAHNVRCRLQVTYHTVQDVAFLRTCLTAAVKYVENKLRSLLAVKSRLSVNLPLLDVKEMIDRYFDAVANKIRTPKAPPPPPEYEKLYDLPKTAPSFRNASEIERSSWDTTYALVTEEELKMLKTETKGKADTEISIKAEEPPVKDASILTEEEGAYLRAVLAGDRAAVRALLARTGRLEDEWAAAINEKSMESIGDVVLLEGEDGYQPIEDYKEEMSEWISQMRGSRFPKEY
ncbi:MAG: TerB N-terminal domain-containing protein [Clostridia bacterium]|nr:TerB N-terminal domain-containing protein [Clostridia bacterium]